MQIDKEYLKSTLLELLMIPSPTGLTDEIVHYVGKQLEQLNVPFELTRTGTIRGCLKGQEPGPDRAIIAHLDTIGAMVTGLKEDGRLSVAPIGHWSSRFAECVRVTIYSDNQTYRGTVMPLLASGHAFNKEVDKQPVQWDNVEIRLDEECHSTDDLDSLGINVGDVVAFDPNPEILSNGFIVSRHLDNKAGVAALLSAIKAINDAKASIPIDCHPTFSLTEEVGTGASSVLEHDVSEMVSIDIAPVAKGQTTQESSATIGMMDSSGPYDYHLTRHLIKLAEEHHIAYKRDVFKFYHSDSASAIAAGYDLRTALICFGGDASHGYERTHIDGLLNVAKLISSYIQSKPTFNRDKDEKQTLEEFSHQIEPDNIYTQDTPLPKPKDYL